MTQKHVRGFRNLQEAVQRVTLNEATRGLVGFFDDDGEIVTFYSHNDNYPDRMIPDLQGTDPLEALHQFMDLEDNGGYFSFFHPDSSESLVRDRGNSSKQVANTMDELKKQARSVDAEYVYLFDTSINAWQWCDTKTFDLRTIPDDETPS